MYYGRLWSTMCHTAPLHRKKPKYLRGDYKLQQAEGWDCPLHERLLHWPGFLSICPEVPCWRHRLISGSKKGKYGKDIYVYIMLPSQQTINAFKLQACWYQHNSAAVSSSRKNSTYVPTLHMFWDRKLKGRVICFHSKQHSRHCIDTLAISTEVG